MCFHHLFIMRYLLEVSNHFIFGKSYHCSRIYFYCSLSKSEKYFASFDYFLAHLGTIIIKAELFDNYWTACFISSIYFQDQCLSPSCLLDTCYHKLFMMILEFATILHNCHLLLFCLFYFEFLYILAVFDLHFSLLFLLRHYRSELFLFG